jgi:prepilin-type N-terminal cleavage/methylation domain-containing protein
MTSSRGFTLLELMIVLVIMATLSVLSSQSIQQAIKSKIKLQRQIDEVSRIRDALRVIERDVNLAFHYTDLESELREANKRRIQALLVGSGTSTTKPGDPNPQTDPRPIYQNLLNQLNQTPESRGDPTTHFVGKDNEMHFATLNAARLAESNLQADFIKVGYGLQSCQRPGKGGSSSNCLVRRTSNIVEGDITKTEEDTVLLTDVSEFKLRYLGKGKQDWVSDWDTAQGDAVTKGRFPDAVEISLAVEKGADNEKKKKVSMQIVAPIRFSNNTARDAANTEAQRRPAPPEEGR